MTTALLICTWRHHADIVVDLGLHQFDAVREMHNGCVLRGGVGTGKSRASLFYFYTRVVQGSVTINGQGAWLPAKRPRDLYIITTAKKRDDSLKRDLEWAAELIPFGLSAEGGSVKGDITVKIDSWNNIANYAEVKDAFFIFDEQRLVGSGAWVKAFLKIAKANQWIILSATPGDNWMDYVPIFVANEFYRNRTEFIRRHVVYNNFSQFPKIDHYVEVHHLEKLRRKVLVEMPYLSLNTRHQQFVVVDYDKEKFERVFKDRWNVFKDEPIKDVQELFSVMRKLVNTDVDRYAALMRLTEKHPRLIVFYNFNYELDMLRVLGAANNIPFAEWNGHKHEEIPGTERWLYFVQYTAGAEGWNCTLTDAMVFWSLNYSYKINEQSKGRIDRMDSPFKDLYYYIFRSNSPIDNSISKKIALKKNFNEKDFMASINNFRENVRQGLRDAT